MKAYAFIRKDGAPLPPGCAGHVGWAITLDDGGILAGSTENQSGLPLVPPGHPNGAWATEFAGEDELLADLRAETAVHPAYDGVTVLGVRHPRPGPAAELGRAIVGWGYTAVGNNCLDHTFKVLVAYGEDGIPWPSTHPSPNDWFAVLIGEYHNL